MESFFNSVELCQSIQNHCFLNVNLLFIFNPNEDEDFDPFALLPVVF